MHKKNKMLQSYLMMEKMFSQFPKITKQKGTENIDKDKKETDFKEYHKKKKIC